MIISKKVYGRIKEKKKKLDSFRPFDKLQLGKIKEQISVEYAYNSASIEGNTLSLSETKLVILEGITIGGKTLREHLDVINQKDALEWIERFVRKKRALKEEDLLTLHRITLKGISEYWAGKYKTSQNRILGSKLKTTPPYKVRDEMRKLVELVRKNPEKYNAIELAAFVHHELVRIHPFVDGNGRCAILLMNIILIKAGYPPVIIKNKDRKKYFDTLEKAHFGELKPFFNFVAYSVDSALMIYLNALIPMTKKTELLPLMELSEYMPYSQEYLSLLARRGRISATKIDGTWFSTREDVDKYVKEQKS